MSIRFWDRFLNLPRSLPPRPLAPADPTRPGGREFRSGGFVLATAVLLTACDPGLGVDPAWATLPLPDVGYAAQDSIADVGAELFRRNCAGCHGYGDAIIGPDMTGVTHRRSPEWIRAMIARPDSMLRVDSIAQALLVQYQIPMLNRELDPARVRAIMEFLWRADHEPAADPDRSSG